MLQMFKKQELPSPASLPSGFHPPTTDPCLEKAPLRRFLSACQVQIQLPGRPSRIADLLQDPKSVLVITTDAMLLGHLETPALSLCFYHPLEAIVPHCRQYWLAQNDQGTKVTATSGKGRNLMTSVLQSSMEISSSQTAFWVSSHEHCPCLYLSTQGNSQSFTVHSAEPC